MKICSTTNCPSPNDKYFSQSLKANSLPETIVSQAQLELACSNSAIITVEQSVKYIQS